MTKWLAVVILLAFSVPAFSQPPSYLNDLPTADRVVKDLRSSGSSARETAIRTSFTLARLGNFVQVMAGANGTGQPAGPEAAKILEYGLAAAAIDAEQASHVDANCEGDGCDKYKLARCEREFVFAPAAYREVLDRYVPSQLQARAAPRFVRAGTVWRDAFALPAGTKFVLDARAAPYCADPAGSWLPSVGGGASSWPGRILDLVLYLPRLLLTMLLGAGEVGISLLWRLGIPLYIVYRIVWGIMNSRRRMLRRSNRTEMQQFGSDQPSRERAILEAFDNPDFTFRYTGVNRQAKTRFVLMRNIKSFRRGDLESMRFAYIAFNRGLIDDERFHWFRFSAIYGDGLTDPSQTSFVGLFSKLRRHEITVDAARGVVKSYAEGNAGKDLESQALAQIQDFAAAHPNDDVFRDMRLRFLEGSTWLTKSEIPKTVFAVPPTPDPYYLHFGPLAGSDMELRYWGNGSIMTVAPPGAGKTECNVIPNLLRWPGPALVLDVKGELYEKTAGWRSTHVGPVIRFSPLDPDNSASYNPLSIVRSEARYVWEDSRLIAELMVLPNPQAGENRIFDDLARLLLTAIIADMAYWNPPDQRPISRIASLLSRNGWNEFVERLRTHPDVPDMQDAGFSLASQARDNPKTLESVLQTAKSSLGDWTGAQIAQITKRSDWAPGDLRSGQNLTIYVCVSPNDIDAYAAMLRVFITQHVQALMPRGEAPRDDMTPVLFLLDEFPQLGRMRPIEKALDTGRGYKIRIWMFAQNLGQLKAAYPNADGMITNCWVRCFMNPGLGDGTAKKLAEDIGYRDTETHGGKGVDESADRKFIVNPTELAGPAFKELQIVWGIGARPAKIGKRYSYKDPELVAKMKTPSPVQDRPGITRFDVAGV